MGAINRLREYVRDAVLGWVFQGVNFEVSEFDAESETEMPEDDLFHEFDEFLSEWKESSHVDDAIDVDGHSVLVRDIPDLTRDALYDAQTIDPEKIMALLGYTAQSAEVAEMSLKESQARTEVVKPLAPLVFVIANALSRAAAVSAGDEDMEEAQEAYAEAMLAATMASLSILQDMGLIIMPDVRVASVRVAGDDDDEDDDE